MLGSSNPLRGSRESGALASGSFLKVSVSVSVSHASLPPTFRAMFPRWQVLVERWAISMSRIGRARDLKQSRKLRTWAPWPSTPLADSCEG